ncbi:hypothetical protein AG1IA_07137 [Rhizoctonia solani AG-1 IA]|uniref:Uncharacterized protein n=1 Tax=Thanatephorus cucumeris (strain AG1-IA) TaxID=983506 RepID=L8WPZ8_THACA|nr:hypothetical protein AG1IA_07137 [Rhizoctonia solani AG-1 IA]
MRVFVGQPCELVVSFISTKKQCPKRF